MVRIFSEKFAAECSKSQILAALSVSIGAMITGFASAYTSSALVSMRDSSKTSFEVNTQMASWVGGIMPLAGLAGGIVGGPMIEYLGRKKTILATGVPFIVAWLFIALANSIWLVLVGRALTGLCIGIVSLSFPVYLGEVIHPKVRGTLGLFPTAFGNLAIVLCFIVGAYLDWRKLAWVGAVIPIPFVILMFLIPETPFWYVSKGREDKAMQALQWLRGPDADVNAELQDMIRSFNTAQRRSSTNPLVNMSRRSNMKPLLISLGLMFFQQFGGINAVIFYTVQIFKDAGSTIDENLCTIIVGIVNLISSFIATILIDKLGRKVLLYVSSAAMSSTLLILGGFFFYKNRGHDISSLGWLPLASFVVYVLGFSLGLGPIPWLMMGEILPSKVRGMAASIATAFNWLCVFVVTKTFIDIIELIGNHGAFWLFGGICIVGIFFSIKYVPETRGKSLDEIQNQMMSKKDRLET